MCNHACAAICVAVHACLRLHWAKGAPCLHLLAANLSTIIAGVEFGYVLLFQDVQLVRTPWRAQPLASASQSAPLRSLTALGSASGSAGFQMGEVEMCEYLSGFGIGKG